MPVPGENLPARQIHLVKIKLKPSMGRVNWSHFHMIFHCIFLSATGLAYMTGFFRQIGFKEIHIGIYGSAIGAAGLFSVFGSFVSQKMGSRKKSVIALLLFSIISCAAGVLTAFFLPGERNTFTAVCVLGFMLFFQLGYYMATPIMLSWYHDLTGNENWQRFFSTRSIVADCSVFTASLVIGSYLGNAADTGMLLTVFLIASAIALAGIVFVCNIPDSPDTEEYEGSKLFIKNIAGIVKNRAFRNLIAVFFLRAFAYSLIATFQPVYLLEKLRFNYTIVSVLIAIGTVASILFYKIWTRIQGRIGNCLSLKLNLLFCVLDPVLWIIAGQVNALSVYIAAGLFGFSSGQGIVNAGFFSSSFGTIFDYSEPGNKSVCMSLYFIVSGIAAFISPLIGAFLLRHFNSAPVSLFNVEMNGYTVIFGVASAVLVASAGLLRSKKPACRLKRDIGSSSLCE